MYYIKCVCIFNFGWSTRGIGYFSSLICDENFRRVWARLWIFKPWRMPSSPPHETANVRIGLVGEEGGREGEGGGCQSADGNLWDLHQEEDWALKSTHSQTVPIGKVLRASGALYQPSMQPVAVYVQCRLYNVPKQSMPCQWKVWHLNVYHQEVCLGWQ